MKTLAVLHLPIIISRVKEYEANLMQREARVTKLREAFDEHLKTARSQAERFGSNQIQAIRFVMITFCEKFALLIESVLLRRQIRRENYKTSTDERFRNHHEEMERAFQGFLPVYELEGKSDLWIEEALRVLAETGWEPSVKTPSTDDPTLQEPFLCIPDPLLEK